MAKKPDVRMSIRLPLALYKEIKRCAWKSEVSIAEAIRIMLKEKFQRL